MENKSDNGWGGVKKYSHKFFISLVEFMHLIFMRYASMHHNNTTTSSAQRNVSYFYKFYNTTC